MTQSVELKVAGQSVRVVSSAGEDELQELALAVDRRLTALAPTGRRHPQALLLVAMALVHDLELERARRVSLQRRTRAFLGRLRERIDGALERAPVEAASGEGREAGESRFT
jgi:cell division protein ZapA